MKDDEESTVSWIFERIAAALVCGIAAAITLFLYPLAFFFFVASHGNGGAHALTLFGHWYQTLFSPFGLALIGAAWLCGLALGIEKMTSVFSLFWGTHDFWSRLEDKLNDWRDEYFSETKLLFVLLALLGVVLLIRFA